MQADVCVHNCVTERLVGGISGHSGLSPVASEVEYCGSTTQTFILMPGNRKVCDLYHSNIKKTKLTHYNCSYEQADNYPKHPEQPLIGRKATELRCIE